MRIVNICEITNLVEELCIRANYVINDDIINSIKNSLKFEECETGVDILEKIIENANIARTENVAVCQDTGMAVVFVDIGMDVHVEGGNLNDAINEGVRRGYKKGYLRKSVLNDPILRKNTEDNTPAIIYYDFCEGDKIEITVAPKGFGSENTSALKMLKPSEGIEGIKNFVIETVEKAGPNACPPLVVGVGIGGTMDKAALIAKKAIIRPIDIRSKFEHIRILEEELLAKINMLGIGPSGLGGRITALGVNVEVYPTHIAGLPVAVNLSCHATRHASGII